jgi:hypothetical protein
VIYNPTGNVGVQAYCIEKTRDHGLVIAGEKDDLAYAAKLDTSGSILWSKTFGSTYGTFWCITATRDSCFVMAGFADNPGDTATDLLCVKINSAGDTLWTRMIDMGYHEEAISIRQTLDNGFIITGDASGEKVVVIKLNASGNLSWGKLFSIYTYENIGCGVDQTADTGYIVTGYTENNSSTEPAMFLMKLTSTGTVSWTKQKNDTSYINSMGFDVHVVQGGIMNLLYASSGGWSLIKTDFSGNVLWGKSYSGNFWAFMGPPTFKLHQTSDGGYAFVTGNPFLGSMIQVDSSGNLVFSKSLVLNATDIVESYSGVFSMVGNGPLWGEKKKQPLVPQVGVIKSDTSGSVSACIQEGNGTSTAYSASFSNVACTLQSAGTVKYLTGPVTNATMTVEDGCVDRTGGIHELNPSVSIHVFPNPNDGIFTVTVDETVKSELQLVEVFNIPGERIYTSSDPSVALAPINIGRVTDGVYTVKVTFRTMSCSQKILISH